MSLRIRFVFRNTLAYNICKYKHKGALNYGETNYPDAEYPSHPAADGGADQVGASSPEHPCQSDR